MHQNSPDLPPFQPTSPSNHQQSQQPRSKAAAAGLKFKTELCRNWVEGTCEFQTKCSFAHGVEELRLPLRLPEKYKTKACRQFFEAGYCMYGGRCQFRHTVRREAERLPVFMKLQERGEREQC